MTERRRAMLILAGILAAALIVPTMLAYAVGRSDGQRDARRLEIRIERLESVILDK